MRDPTPQSTWHNNVEEAGGWQKVEEQLVEWKGGQKTIIVSERRRKGRSWGRKLQWVMVFVVMEVQPIELGFMHMMHLAASVLITVENSQTLASLVSTGLGQRRIEQLVLVYHLHKLCGWRSVSFIWEISEGGSILLLGRPCIGGRTESWWPSCPSETFFFIMCKVIIKIHPLNMTMSHISIIHT